MKFEDHALYRFRERRPDLFIMADSPGEIEEQAHLSYRTGYLITRREAMERVDGPIRASTSDVFFRADGTGPGVWIACRTSRGREVALTYIAPHYSVEEREIDLAVQGLIGAVG